MKYPFDDQPHQAAAIAAVTDLFEGAVTVPSGTPIGQAPGAAGHGGFALDHDVLEENLATVTAREDVEEQKALSLLVAEDLQGEERSFPNFSVEMETGTGKTYVYIGTALRLAETYGFRKFVILVHSVAIRAGAISTFEQSYDHFRAKHPTVPYRWGVLGEGTAADDFTEPSGTVQFLVASVQAIDKPDSNTVYQQAEQPQLWGDPDTGMNAIAAARPVVIIDEPQNMATEKRRQAIATLNPIVALRYSATHREQFNLVHRLGPRAAMEAGLVKRVSVKGVVAGDEGVPYLMFKKLRSKNRRLMADVVIDANSKTWPRRTEVVLQNGSDLFEESGGLEQYRGMVVDHFERKPDRIFFEGRDEPVEVGQETGVNREAVWEDQVRHTVRQHLARQAQVDSTGRNVKVLSLFFVERVADYVGDDAVLPEMFDRVYREEWDLFQKQHKTKDPCPDPEALRVHYFPSTKTGIYKDTKGNQSDAEFEARAYEEIIKDKRKILDRSNPRAFIFSHSALKEGWDNPNVFQVGFLRHSRSDLERRQQIGRGLRLPVDDTLHRVMDPETCRLTLVVDESFADFRDGLNKEYAAAGGGGGDAPEPDDLDKQVTIKRRKPKYESTEFQEMWKRIRYKARYRVTVDATALPELVAESEHLDAARYLARRGNVVQEGHIEYDDDGTVITKDSAVAESKGHDVSIAGRRLPNLVRLIEDQLVATKYPLRLTRPTVTAVLAALPGPVKKTAIHDPARWARIVAEAVRTVTVEKMVNHIVYTADEDEAGWWDADLVFIESETVNPPPEDAKGGPKRGVSKARADGTNLFDHVHYDSDVEKSFSEMLDNNPNVRLFTKLPRRFSVRTPVGDYSPDWAVVYEDEDTTRLYLVRETKDTDNLDDLDWDEAMRIRFAKRHFAAAPNGSVDYVHTSGNDLRVELDGAGT